MSTEVAKAQTPEMAKNKKSKSNPDGSIKKRKREEEQAANAQADGEPTAKKSKKRKSKGGDEVKIEEESANVTAVSPEKTTKKPKVVKIEEAETPAVEAKEKKKKKKQKQADNVVPTVGSAAIATPAKKPKSKKDRPLNEAEATAGSSKDADHRATKHSQAQVQSDDVLEAHTPFHEQTASFYLALSPCAQSFPVEGLCAEHISPLLLTYFAPLKGVVISYSNPRLSEGPDDVHPSSSKTAVLAQSIDEYAVNFVWLTADFTIFKPSRGTYLEGYVNLQNESLLGLVCYNYFNAGIDRTRLPQDWKWVGDENGGSKGKNALTEGEGYWVNGEGEKVEGRLVFKVKDFEPTPAADGTVASINIAGTLLSEADDKKVDEQESKRR